MAPQAGILYVTMAPQASLPAAQFHDWYDNEHGPLRLRLPYITNGFRYRANDMDGKDPTKEPEWMAAYDVTDMNEMTKEQYTRLRREPIQTQRERDTMKQIKVDRKFYDLVLVRTSSNFEDIEQIGAQTKDVASVLVARIFTLKEGAKDKEEEFLKWYDEEHLPMLEKVPGWRRGRVYKSSSIEPVNEVQYLALHNYLPENGLGGEEFQAAISTPWKKDIVANVIDDRSRRTFDLYYTFGPAPRDLAAPASLDALASWNYSDGVTKTYKEKERAIVESYVTTADGAVLPYRLEGSTNPEAPLIILCNSVLVTWGIWDAFVEHFLSDPKNQHFRILRYNSRGRTANTGSQNITLDVLAADIITILDALRVPKAASLFGVSLGGATVLNAALKYPSRVGSFISCDTNSKSPAGNSTAWAERIDIAEKQGIKAQSGEPLVGSELAEKTVRRWFVPESYDGGVSEKEIQRVKDMVASNSLDGFKKGVRALFDYDVEGLMRSSKVKGAFVVGAGDGVLPKTMAEMAKNYGDGVHLAVIDGAGHLPMVEKPREFADVVERFMAG
ncbi:putative alpha/beta hydrolase [Pseudovirgaria hyperparasitica]|uniref:Putative alpha/beta hydrolase n=1 Tax=Pseudovirgaria hyperparasitica TaxID=470096 RepID=A0A6A6W329_9PEZI|nr:putative alpha/beta hydrolase [Pseudovirgaria hyperparasitica]KAF2756424.1 putative alpha/beta hydrolase [Pseudovirgaria hyperparasitica]